MSLRPSPRALLLALAAAAVVACGGGSSAVPSAAPTDVPVETDAAATPTSDGGAVPTPGTSLTACELVTPEDVAAATGVTSVDPGEPKDKATSLSPGRTECTYQGEFGRIIAELTPEDGANLYDAARGSYDDASDITGPWDGAFWSAQNKRAFVWKGAVTVMFTMFLSGSEPPAVAEALGTAIVEKL